MWVIISQLYNLKFSELRVTYSPLWREITCQSLTELIAYGWKSKPLNHYSLIINGNGAI